MRNFPFRKRVRRGMAAVECAVTLPILVVLVFGGLEVSNSINVQHSLQEASMNGCRLYALADKTKAEAQAMVDLAMQEDGITGYTVTFDPASKAGIVTDLEPVTVTVSVPYSSVELGITRFMAGKTLTASTVLPASVD